MAAAGLRPSFTSPLHDERAASLLGVAVGLAFAVCFVTGVLSHLIQHPPGWFTWPSRPAGLYRVTQGLHVATGTAAVPLLLAKLWTVYPHLWARPPIRDATHAVERVLLLPLVGGSIFLLSTGLANIARWYPWSFSFPRTHYWVAWITLGALVAHVGVKLPVVRRSLGRHETLDTGRYGVSRRQFLAGAATASGVVTLATVGQTVGPLAAVSLLGVRDPRVGPQGVPVNKTAQGAGVVARARDPAYRLEVSDAVAVPLSFSLDELRAMPQRHAVLPIACVEGWSRSARWTGVPVRDLLELVGADPSEIVVESLQPRGSYRSSVLAGPHLRDRDTLLALELNGEALHLDHGYPLRLIAPNRPGVLQTKWVHRLVLR